MKRLLRISFDLALTSLIPVISWFVLGILIDKNLTNVFTLIYPIQFIWYICQSIFSTGANICMEKNKDENITMSAILVGSIFGFIIFGCLILNIDEYIKFMNMDVNIYRNFAIYGIVQLYLQLILNFYIQKLYYENKNKEANYYSVGFNWLNLIVLIVSSILFKDDVIIIGVTLLTILLLLLFVVIKESNKFKFSFDLWSCIKYDSVELFNKILFFFIYLFGLSNALEYGIEYASAITFIVLITDTQWDAYESITVAAKIDISKNNFNYKQHLYNAYKLLSILLSLIITTFLLLYNFYHLNTNIVLTFLIIELFNFAVYPIYKIKTCFLQLEYSSLKTTVNKITSSSLRLVISFLKTPYCTSIGQTFSAIYQIITINIFFNRHYYISKDGFIMKKSNINRKDIKND